MKLTSSLLVRNRIEVHPISVSPPLGEESSYKVLWPRRLDSSKELTRFLFYLLERRGFTPSKPFVAYQREASYLVKEFDHNRLHKAMLKAAELAKHPWGFSFVRECLETLNNF